MQRPERDEYVDYYHVYTSKVPDGDIFRYLEEQRDRFAGFLSGIPAEREGYRYAPGKWSVKDVVGHINDAERLFAYRAMAFARNDRTPLPAFEQDDYVAQANFDNRSLESLRAEFVHIRNGTLSLFGSFDDEIWIRRGTASGFEFTVRAVAWILAGHVIHHHGVLGERYL